MDKHSKAALVLMFVVMSLLGFSYIKHETLTYRLNGSTFLITGMMEYDDNGKRIYLPVFRRIN